MFVELQAAMPLSTFLLCYLLTLYFILPFLLSWMTPYSISALLPNKTFIIVITLILCHKRCQESLSSH